MAVKDFGGNGRRQADRDHLRPTEQAHVGAANARQWLDTDKATPSSTTPYSASRSPPHGEGEGASFLFPAPPLAISPAVLLADRRPLDATHLFDGARHRRRHVMRAATPRFFLTADYAFGPLERDTGKVVRRMAARCARVRAPLNNADFSSFLRQAHASTRM